MTSEDKLGECGVWRKMLFGTAKVPLKKRLLRIAAMLVGVLVAWVLFLWFYLAQPSFQSSPQVEISANQVLLEQHVRKLSEEFVPRNAYSLGNTKRTADYIQFQFDAATGNQGRAKNLLFESMGAKQRNVSLMLGENAQTAGRERIVVGAHYDSYDKYPGADDNASGVAGVIELARLLAPVENKLGCPVELVCYPMEEPPYFGTEEMGSAYHARRLAREGVGCKLMISMEMIGYFSDEWGSQGFPLPGLELVYPNRGNFIIVAGNTENRAEIRSVKGLMKGATPLPVYSISSPASLPGIDFSDHRNYWELGFPAVMITDTAFYRNKAYHTPEDTADRLDFTRMGMLVEATYNVILGLACTEGD